MTVRRLTTAKGRALLRIQRVNEKLADAVYKDDADRQRLVATGAVTEEELAQRDLDREIVQTERLKHRVPANGGGRTA